MFNFCTYFDSNYIIKGLALYHSLVRHATPFRLWVLCFDDLACETLNQLNLTQVIPISLRDFEDGDKELLEAKRNRSRIEYYFTCTPSLPLYILNNHPEVDIITYIDADLFFYANPSPIYQALGNGSVLIVGHRFPPHLSHMDVHGIYNVGFLTFRRDSAGLQCLDWWRNRCLEWCYDRVEDGRFADQKYLDDWPTRFQGVVVLQHKGGGLAPWNVENYTLHIKNGKVLVDSQPLVFFHFHGLNQMRRWLYNPDLMHYGVHSDSLLKRRIYGPYIRKLHETAYWLPPLVDQSRICLASIRGGNYRLPSGSSFRKTVRGIKHKLSVLKRVFQGHLWIVIGGRIL